MALCLFTVALPPGKVLSYTTKSDCHFIAVLHYPPPPSAITPQKLRGVFYLSYKPNEQAKQPLAYELLTASLMLGTSIV